MAPALPKRVKIAKNQGFTGVDAEGARVLARGVLLQSPLPPLPKASRNTNPTITLCIERR